MKAHQLDTSGMILNTIVVDSLTVFPNLVDANIGGTFGDKIVDGKLVQQGDVPPEVPESVAMWQARSVMIADGILAAVVAALAGITDPVARAQAQAKFEYSSTVRRDDPLVKNIIPALGKSEAQIDSMFIRAAVM